MRSTAGAGSCRQHDTGARKGLERERVAPKATPEHGPGPPQHRIWGLLAADELGT